MHQYIRVFMIAILTGCTALSQTTDQTAGGLFLEAQTAIENGEYYRARKFTQQLLAEDPDNQEYQTLMALVLEKEIAQQKEVFETKVPEEFDAGENAEAAKTWLERAQEYFRRAQYQEAIDAAGKVFSYDPDNVEASDLIDRVHKQARAEGKEQRLILKKIHQDEMNTRVKHYKDDVRTMMEKGQWGKAKLTVEKMMLLDPKDKEAVKLHEEILKHSEARKL